jgi:protein-S-isoprenylcysteine O-methyltransferase Ste14
MGAYGALHSILASLAVKSLVRQVTGSLYDRLYRLFFVIFVSLILLPVLYLVVALPDEVLYRIPMPWAILTSALQMGSLGALAYALMQTGPFLFVGLRQAAEGAEPAPHFTQDGLYGIVRHPLYTFSMILIWLMPVMSWNLLAFNIGASGYMVVGMIFEERKLVLEFGEVYLNYRRRVPALVPRVFRLNNQDR